MAHLAGKTTFATTHDVRKRAKYISASLGIPVSEVIEQAVKEMQARYNLPDPPTLQGSGKANA